MPKGLVKSIAKFIRKLRGLSSGKACPQKIKRSLQYGDREWSGRLLNVSTVLDPIRWMFALLASGASHPRPVHAISLQSVPGLMTRGSLEAKFDIPNSWWGRQPRCWFSAAIEFDGSVLCAIAANTLGIFIAHALDEQRTCCQCRLISSQCATLAFPFLFGIPNFAVLFRNLPSFTSPYRWYGPPSLCLNPSHLALPGWHRCTTK